MVVVRAVRMDHSTADSMVLQKALMTVDQWVQTKDCWTASMKVTKRALWMARQLEAVWVLQ